MACTIAWNAGKMGFSCKLTCRGCAHGFLMLARFSEVLLLFCPKEGFVFLACRVTSSTPPSLHSSISVLALTLRQTPPITKEEGQVESRCEEGVDRAMKRRRGAMSEKGGWIMAGRTGSDQGRKGKGKRWEGSARVGGGNPPRPHMFSSCVISKCARSCCGRQQH